MKTPSSFAPARGCQNALLAMAFFVCVSVPVTEAQVTSDDFNTAHVYWEEFGSIDVSGTIWDGVQGENFAEAIDTTWNPGQLTMRIWDIPVSNGSTGNPFGTSALYMDVAGDFDAQVLMPSFPDPDAMYPTLSLGAWTADQVNAIHVDNIAGVGAKVRFRDQEAPDEFSLAMDRQPWLRLTRNGDVFTGYYGTDGNSWTQIGSMTRDYGATLRVGLTAWNAMPLQFEAVFDDFSIGPPPPLPTVTEWSQPGFGDWSEGTNWTTGIPDANDFTAVFGGMVGMPTTVVTNADVTVNRIEFDNAANSYAVAGLGSVALAPDDGTDPSVEVFAGNHQMQVAVNLTGNTTVAAAAGTQIDFNNQINRNGNVLTIEGDGQVNLNNIVLAGEGGGAVNSSGTMGGGGSSVIGGDLVSTGTLDIDIGGTDLMEFDSFMVGGTATLSGLINIDLIDGFSPTDGDQFDVVIADTIVDNGLTLAGDSEGFNYSIVSGSDILRLTFGAAFEADFDGDGDVDGDDFLAWQTGFGTPTGVQKSDGDYDNDGDVDGDDFLGWQVEFPSPGAGAGSTAVPEPATLVLALLGSLAFALRRRR